MVVLRIFELLNFQRSQIIKLEEGIKHKQLDKTREG